MKCEDCGDAEATRVLDVCIIVMETGARVIGHPLCLCEDCAHKAYRNITHDD
jgi:hypothetical protein